jgi:hypothetical protein
MAAATQTANGKDALQALLIDQARAMRADETFLSGTNFAKAQEIVNAIAGGKLVPNIEGVVILPPEYGALSTDGKVLATAVNGKPMAILFINWIGKGSNLIGYLFYPGSLDSLGRRQEYDDSMTIEIIGPRPDWPPNDTAKVRVRYEATKTVNWYHVMRTED